MDNNVENYGNTGATHFTDCISHKAGDDMGNVSDGYHTFNELYHHRACLFSTICNLCKSIAWKSKKHSDGSMYEGMFIVGINTPEGQATYHYNLDPYWEMFHVKELPYAPEYDGHTPDDTARRILSINYQCMVDGCVRKDNVL